MIIIAFAPHTSKIIPRIFCRRFRHCAPIAPAGTHGKKFTMYQFVGRRNIAQIQIELRDIQLLRAHGWEFVYLPRDLPHDFNHARAMTCVGLSKQSAGIHAPWIQTPNALRKYLTDTK